MGRSDVRFGPFCFPLLKGFEMSVNIKNSSALAALRNLSAKRSGSAPVKSDPKPKAGLTPAVLEDEEEDEEDEEYEDDDEDEDEDYESEDSEEESVDESDDESDDEDEADEDEDEPVVNKASDSRLIREPLIALIQLIVKHHQSIIDTLRDA